jgi:O-antigen/teichoic acid export membrane protein
LIRRSQNPQKSAPGGRKTVLRTAILNVLMTLCSAITGLVIARVLGPSGRGQYAGVTAWFGIALIVGELGQPAALTFYVASNPGRAADYLATGRRFMIATGLLTATVGWFIAPLLGRDDAVLVDCYRLMFSTCILSFIVASLIFPLQARDLPLWNIARAVQPMSYLLIIIVMDLIVRLTLLGTIVSLVVSVIIQILAATVLCRRVGLYGGAYDSKLARPLVRYGSSQLAASAPTSVNGRLDQLILSTTTSFHNLGIYAVAVSISAIAVPAVSAIGSVMFPRIAARKGESTHLLEGRAVRASAIVSVCIMLPVCIGAPFLIPILFGAGYGASVRLVWILAVGAVFLGSGQVIGDLLRGRGQPLAVAIGQGIGAALTVALLLLLLPIWGIVGAAVASTLAYALTFAVLLFTLRRSPLRQQPHSLQSLTSESGERP